MRPWGEHKGKIEYATNGYSKKKGSTSNKNQHKLEVDKLLYATKIKI